MSDLRDTLLRWAKARQDENECDVGSVSTRTCAGCAFVTVCKQTSRNDYDEYRTEKAIISVLEDSL